MLLIIVDKRDFLRRLNSGLQKKTDSSVLCQIRYFSVWTRQSCVKVCSNFCLLSLVSRPFLDMGKRPSQGTRRHLGKLWGENKGSRAGSKEKSFPGKGKNIEASTRWEFKPFGQIILIIFTQDHVVVIGVNDRDRAFHSRWNWNCHSKNVGEGIREKCKTISFSARSSLLLSADK